MSSIANEVLAFRRKLQQQYQQLGEGGVDFLISAQTTYNPFMPTEKFHQWFKEQNSINKFHLEFIPLCEMDGWRKDENDNIRHDSGKFFSIEGVRVRISSESRNEEWTQPIINQPEVGILCILCKKFDGILYFLMQLKKEPGNINQGQLSPTVQATRSNYTKVHKGNLTPYIEYILDFEHGRILIDQLQSEQGSRFLKKRNRNMIIELDEDQDIEVLPGYCWLTLGQLKDFIKQDNLVNMDTRTVLSCTNLQVLS